MVQAYWQLGRIIVEHEQKGNLRVAYGKAVLQELYNRLAREFGKGFDVRKLRNMRLFYCTFPNWNAVGSELTWTHYRPLLALENEKDPYVLEFLDLMFAKERGNREIFCFKRRAANFCLQIPSATAHPRGTAA